MSDDLITGRNENAPFRAQLRVFLLIAVVVLIVGGIAYGLYAAFGGKQHGSTVPVVSLRL